MNRCVLHAWYRVTTSYLQMKGFDTSSFRLDAPFNFVEPIDKYLSAAKMSWFLTFLLFSKHSLVLQDSSMQLLYMFSGKQDG